MTNSVKELNEIVRNLSSNNANTSISQFVAIIDLCSKAGIKLSFDENYEESLASFAANKFPEWNNDHTNTEIELSASNAKYEEAVAKRDKALMLKNEIHRQFRLEKYGTADWFIEKSESEILFLPTNIAVIDSLFLK